MVVEIGVNSFKQIKILLKFARVAFKDLENEQKLLKFSRLLIFVFAYSLKFDHRTQRKFLGKLIIRKE